MTTLFRIALVAVCLAHDTRLPVCVRNAIWRATQAVASRFIKGNSK